MILKLTKYTNTPGTFEAEWFNREVTPAVGTEGEEGYQPESTNDTTLRVIAYSGDQIDLFRADVAQYGGEIDEALLADVQAAWVESYVPPAPEPLTVADFDRALTTHLDETAQSRRYDSRVTCALRAGYPGPFQAEGQAFAAWMDTCNAQAYTLLAEVQSGVRPLPESTKALIDALPPMVWPA